MLAAEKLIHNFYTSEEEVSKILHGVWPVFCMYLILATLN